LGGIAVQATLDAATPDVLKGTDAWFNKYDKIPADLKAALAAAKDVPVDVDPIFSFAESAD